jgi:hypothetical protein
MRGYEGGYGDNKIAGSSLSIAISLEGLCEIVGGDRGIQVKLRRMNTYPYFLSPHLLHLPIPSSYP